MDLKKQIKPITYLKNNTAELVREVAESGKTVIVTQNGEAKIAVVSVDTYNRWQKALGLLKLAAHAEADIEAGRTISQKEVFKAAETTIQRVENDG